MPYSWFIVLIHTAVWYHVETEFMKYLQSRKLILEKWLHSLSILFLPDHTWLLLIMLLICSLDHLYHHTFKANIDVEFIYCCFQLLPQGINIMMTSALKTCFIFFFFSKVRMDLGKIAKNLGLTLFWISIVYRVCTHICHTDTNSGTFYLQLGPSAFLIFILSQDSQKKLLPNSGERCFFFASYTRTSLMSNSCYSNGNWVLNYTLGIRAGL